MFALLQALDEGLQAEADEDVDEFVEAEETRTQSGGCSTSHN